MNSFIENVNYISGLDNKYGDEVYLLKNNLVLMNTANDINLSFKYFDFNARVVKEIRHVKNGVLYTGLGSVLAEFINKINISVGSSFVASYALLNLTIGFEVRIISNNPDFKVHELNFNARKSQDNVEIYNLYGEVRNTLSILPSLAMLDKSVTDGFAIAGRHIEDIITVSDNIEDVITVSEDIASVNSVAYNIVDVNTVSSSINNVNDVGENISAVINVHNNIDSIIIDAENIGNIVIVGNDLSEVGFSNLVDMGSISDPVEQESTGISLIETVAVNIEDVRTIADNIDIVNDVHINMDSIVIDANNIGNINIVANDLRETGFSNLIDMGSVSDPVVQYPIGISLIETVAVNISDVIANGQNIDKIITVADNIVDIQNAEENALIAIEKADIATTKAHEASDSEECSYKWAQNPEDVIVKGTFGVDDEYSAYHWAMKAEAVAGGSVSVGTLHDVDITGLLDGGMIRYDYSQLKWIAYDFNHNDVIGFNLTSGTSANEGQLAWNNTEKTLDMGLSNGNTIQIGQGSVRLVKNSTTETIEAGTLVMLDGAISDDDRIKIKPFTGGFDDAILCYGVANQDIIAGSNGLITIEGKARSIDTTGTSAGEVWEDGDILYAKPDGNGMITNVVPEVDELRMPVAIVIKAHTNGTLEVRFNPINENIYYTKEQNDILLANKVPLTGDFNLDLGEI